MMKSELLSSFVFCFLCQRSSYVGCYIWFSEEEIWWGVNPSSLDSRDNSPIAYIVPLVTLSLVRIWSRCPLSFKLHLRDGRTDGRTDAGNRIWCICNIWWQ